MQLTAVPIPALEGGYTAVNPETGTTSQGETIEEALTNLREATALYLEEFVVPNRKELKTGTLSGALKQAGIRSKSS